MIGLVAGWHVGKPDAAAFLVEIKDLWLWKGSCIRVSTSVNQAGRLRVWRPWSCHIPGCAS